MQKRFIKIYKFNLIAPATGFPSGGGEPGKSEKMKFKNNRIVKDIFGNEFDSPGKELVDPEEIARAKKLFNLGWFVEPNSILCREWVTHKICRVEKLIFWVEY